MFLEFLLTGFGKSLMFCLLLWVLKDVWNLEHSKVITTKLLVSKRKDKVEDLSKFGLKAFPIGSGDKEGFTEGDTSVGNCTAASKSSFLQDLKTETTDSLMHSGELKNFFTELTNVLSFSLNFPNE